MPEPTKTSDPLLRFQDVTRAYGTGADVIRVLDGVTLDLASGEILAITGPSGSGKTTLLNIAAGLDRQTAGEVIVLGRKLERLSESEMTKLRAHEIGLIFQDPHLLPGLTALENVVAAKLPWRRPDDLEREGRDLLSAVGLEQRADFPPSRLSGGERQRVALARGLMGRPAIVLADEPTGNLDSASKAAVIALLHQLQQSFGFALVLVTHDRVVAELATRVVRLTEGRLVPGEATL